MMSGEAPNVGCSECGWRGIRDSYTVEMIEVFEPKGESKFKKVLRLIRGPFSVFNRVTKRFAGAIAIVALLLGGGGVYLGVGPYLNYNNTDPEFDGYVQRSRCLPRSNRLERFLWSWCMAWRAF